MRYTADQKCPMRDGTLTNFDLYLPDSAAPCPALLMRTPYTKATLTREGIYASFQRFVDRGYAVIVMECRGTGASEGRLNANAVSEYDDGYDSVEWIARQEWCDGKVGMMGLSYFGFTQLAAASMAPPALKALCPFMTQAIEPFGTQVTQTVNYGHLGWMYGQLLAHMERFVPDAELRARVEPQLREYGANLQKYALCLPANRNPAALVPGVPLLQDYLDIVNGIEDKAFWASLRHPTDFSAIRAAMFHCTGWFDVCLDTTVRDWRANQTECEPSVREESRLIIGPWAHGGGFSTAFGPYDFGAENDGIGQDINGKMLKWFDRYLKGKADALKGWAKVRYFLLGEERWLEDTDWPPTASTLTPYYLREGGRLDRLAPRAREAADSYVYDPMNPAPAYARGKDGAFEQIPDCAPLAERADTLTYETEPLAALVRMAGTLRMRLYAVTDAPDTDFTCRVVDVYPDGREFALAAGLVRGKWREGMFRRAPLTPGEATEFDFEIGNAGCAFLAGHRIKIHLSSALFPLYDRNLNTGEPSGQCAEYRIARQTILHDSEHPSRLLLPLLPAAESPA